MMRKIASGVIGIVWAVSPLFALAAFPDVGPSHPNLDAIEYLQSEGIVQGYPDGTFQPNQTINRVEFIKIILEAWVAADPGTGHVRGIPPCFFHESRETFHERTGTIGMYDVDFNAWYGKYLCQALSGNIVSGYPDGTFRPSRTINFVEAAKIIANVFLSEDLPATQEEVSGNQKLAGLAFSSPPEWGNLVKQETEGEEDFWVFSGFQDINADVGYGANNHVTATLRPYDEYENRYEYVCSMGGYDCVKDTPIDLLAQRASIAAAPNLTVAGIPIQVKDSYYAPAATVLREYTFFTQSHRWKVHGMCDCLLGFYDEEYERRKQSGSVSSISELVYEDLGLEAEDPIRRLIALYSDEAVGMQQFYSDLDVFVQSMKNVEGEWFQPYVDALTAHSAIPSSISRFDQQITRGEMAEMIYRISNTQ